jgi:DNA-binding XRE family transcriptional regulator
MEHEGAPARPGQAGGTGEVGELHETGGLPEIRESSEIGEIDEAGEQLPLLPGFREMALRRMAAQRRRLVTDLAAERQAARLSQTEVAARMGTSQSAVARLESGEADARASTLERYAAAIGCQISWQLQGSGPTARREDTSGDGYASS